MKFITIILISLLLILVGCSSSNYDSIFVDEFAMCIDDAGAVFYGAFWCPHCVDTKKSFGNSFQYITYVECDPRGDDEQAEFCIEKKIEGYPTWEFQDGSRLEGELSFKTLSEKTGCSLPLKN